MRKEKEFDEQLIDWRNKNIGSISERVGLVFDTKDNDDVKIEVNLFTLDYNNVK